jgi:hypothetical protein
MGLNSVFCSFILKFLENLWILAFFWLYFFIGTVNFLLEMRVGDGVSLKGLFSENKVEKFFL